MNHVVFNGEKAVSDLLLQGRLWWIPVHPTLIQLKLSCGKIRSMSHHHFQNHYLSLSNRTVPAFIS